MDTLTTAIDGDLAQVLVLLEQTDLLREVGLFNFRREVSGLVQMARLILNVDREIKLLRLRISACQSI